MSDPVFGSFEHRYQNACAELAAANKRIAELEARLEIAGAHPFPKDFDALDLAIERNKTLLAENERLRAAINALIDGLWDKHSLFISLTLDQHGLDSKALAAARENE